MFYGIHTALIVLGAAVILLPVKSLVQTMLASQTLNGIVLPVILIVMLWLLNDKKLLGKYANPRWYNILAWVIVSALVILTGLLLVTSVFPGLL
jgi:Mn2+/Fe2+ NRAMP family transporter